MSEILYFSKVRENEDAVIPSKRQEDAGFDIYASLAPEEDYILIPNGATRAIPTNIASAISPGYYIQIEERGSTGIKGIKKSAGVIDAGYRDEWFIAITNVSGMDVYIARKEKAEKLENQKMSPLQYMVYPYEKAIVQAVVHKLPDIVAKEIPYETLKQMKSERQGGKVGSTGK